MRYIIKFIGEGQYGVIDTKAPKEVVGCQKYGHVLLWSNNGSCPVQTAADALNAKEEKILQSTASTNKSSFQFPKLKDMLSAYSEKELGDVTNCEREAIKFAYDFIDKNRGSNG